MDGRELVLETKGGVDTKCSEDNNIAERNMKKHSTNSEKAIQETNGLAKIANIPSNDMKDDVYKKRIANFQDAQMVDEKKKETQQNGRQASLEQKTKQIPKQNRKGRCTVPQPFSLSSVKGTPKTRSSLQESKPSLSRSLSFKSNSPGSLRRTQTSLRSERMTELSQGITKSGAIQCVHTQSSLKIERSIELRNNNQEHSVKQAEVMNQKNQNGQRKQVEIKRSQSISNFKELKKLEKGSSFKAAPLPSFYRKRSLSLKPSSPESIDEMKTNDAQMSKFKAIPLPSFYHKKSSSQKTEVIKITLTHSKLPNVESTKKPTSELGCCKMESTNIVASRPISKGAKEMVNSILKGKAPAKQSKGSKNIRPSYGNEIEKRVVSSVEKSELVETN